MENTLFSGLPQNIQPIYPKTVYVYKLILNYPYLRS